MGSPESIRYVNVDDAIRLVNKHAAEMAILDARSERGYAHLGWLLWEVAAMQYWRVRYETFREYLVFISQVSKRTVEQLQRYLLTVRDLSEVFTLEQLEMMGITKAMKVRAAKDYAIVLPAAIKEAALDARVSVKDLKKIIATTLKMPEEDDGDWMDCEMEGPVTAEMRTTIEKAIDVAIHTEPLTKPTLSKPAQMMDVIFKFAQEFLGAHCGDGN